jgi:hypothetical protein
MGATKIVSGKASNMGKFGKPKAAKGAAAGKTGMGAKK